MSAMTEPAATPPPPPPPKDAWRPPKSRDSNVAPIVVGLVFLAIGIWYFLDQTLGLTMPRIRWDDLWPVILIVIGGVILFRSVADRGR